MSLFVIVPRETRTITSSASSAADRNKAMKKRSGSVRNTLNSSTRKSKLRVKAFESSVVDILKLRGHYCSRAKNQQLTSSTVEKKEIIMRLKNI